MSEASQSNVSNETILEFIREATATKRAIEEATGRHRAVLKRAKNAGCNPKIISSAIVSRRQDPAVVVSEVRETVRTFNLVGIEMGSSDLFGGWSGEITEKAAEQHSAFSVKEAGYEAGKAGTDRAGNPHEPGSPFHQRWDEGWIAGQAAIAARMMPGATQANASRKRPERTEATGAAPEPKRRGRPPGSKNRPKPDAASPAVN
jgi:hypothetical protein